MLQKCLMNVNLNQLRDYIDLGATTRKISQITIALKRICFSFMYQLSEGRLLRAGVDSTFVRTLDTSHPTAPPSLVHCLVAQGCCSAASQAAGGGRAGKGTLSRGLLGSPVQHTRLIPWTGPCIQLAQSCWGSGDTESLS